MSPALTFRAIAAEAIATAFVLFTDPDMRIIGVDPDEVHKRAELKAQMDPEFKMALAMAINSIEKARDQYSDYRIGMLLQDGVHTMNSAGRELTVTVEDESVRVKSILTGAGLDVADGAFVIFVDSRALTGAELRKWQELTGDDTHVMVIPVEVPEGHTVEGMVAAKRQDESGFVKI